MIKMTLVNCKWGTSQLGDDGSPEAKGIQINLLDEQAGILVEVPFTGDSRKALIAHIAASLTDEDKKELSPLFDTNDIALPGRDFDPSQITPDGAPKQGPQG